MEHYYTQNPNTPHDFKKIEYVVGEEKLEFITDAGVFSRDKVDYGTDVMIRTLPPLSGDVLDLGCGYGAIGISIAKLNPNARVIMVDINHRAIDLAHKNIQLNKINNAKALQSQGFENVKGTFDTIVSNPPIRTGKKVIYPLFESSIEYLKPGGAFYLVIQKKQGAKSAVEKLKSVYNNCEVIEKKGGYWILKSTKEY